MKYWTEYSGHQVILEGRRNKYDSTIYTKNTYDERVQEILDKKKCLSGYLIDNKDSGNLNIFNENAES